MAELYEEKGYHVVPTDGGAWMGSVLECYATYKIAIEKADYHGIINDDGEETECEVLYSDGVGEIYRFINNEWTGLNTGRKIVL